WESCPPDLTWHVRLADPVDGPNGLADLAARLMTQPLPLDRPMWELLVVPGAGTHGPGIIFRLHHSVADGVAAVALVQELVGGVSVAAPVLSEHAAPPGAVSPRRRLRTAITGVQRITAVFRTSVPPTVLLGRIGPHRGVAFAE